jgi:hypothetical protein
VALWAGGARVEPDTVVLEAEKDVVILLPDRDPHVPRLGVLQRVHHSLAGDVIHEQGDRGRELDIGHVPVEPDRRIPAHLLGEGLEGLGKTLRPEG